MIIFGGKRILSCNTEPGLFWATRQLFWRNFFFQALLKYLQNLWLMRFFAYSVAGFFAYYLAFTFSKNQLIKIGFFFLSRQAISLTFGVNAYCIFTWLTSCLRDFCFSESLFLCFFKHFGCKFLHIELFTLVTCTVTEYWLKLHFYGWK